MEDSHQTPSLYRIILSRKQKNTNCESVCLFVLELILYFNKFTFKYKTQYLPKLSILMHFLLGLVTSSKQKFCNNDKNIKTNCNLQYQIATYTAKSVKTKSTN